MDRNCVKFPMETKIQIRPMIDENRKMKIDDFLQMFEELSNLELRHSLSTETSRQMQNLNGEYASEIKLVIFDLKSSFFNTECFSQMDFVLERVVMS